VPYSGALELTALQYRVTLKSLFNSSKIFLSLYYKNTSVKCCCKSPKTTLIKYTTTVLVHRKTVDHNTTHLEMESVTNHQYVVMEMKKK